MLQHAKLAITVPVLTYQLVQKFGLAGLNLRAIDRVAYYPKLGIAFNRIKKNANTSVVFLLRELESGALSETRSEAKKRSKSVLNVTVAEAAGISRLDFLVVVRNPYSRVLSAFLDKFRFDHYRQRFGAFELTPSGFGTFLNWLDAGGLGKNGHWDLQTKLMLLPAERYDRVIRFENLKQEMTEFLRAKHIDATDEILTGLHPADLNKKTGADGQMAQYYSPARRDLVAKLYRKDFESLGYDTALQA